MSVVVVDLFYSLPLEKKRKLTDCVWLGRKVKRDEVYERGKNVEDR